MKYLLTILLVIAATAFLKPNPLMKSQIDVHNKSGKRIEFIRQNPLNKNQWDVFNKDGKRKGFFRPNVLNSDRIEYFQNRE